MKEKIRKWLENGMPVVDKMAGKRAISMAVEAIHAGMTWEWNENDALSTAVSVIGHYLRELSGLRQRRRAFTQNILNLPDQGLTRQELIKCWTGFRHGKLTGRQKKLLKKNPPGTEACEALYEQEITTMEQVLNILFLAVGRMNDIPGEDVVTDLEKFCIEALNTGIHWRARKHAVMALKAIAGRVNPSADTTEKLRKVYDTGSPFVAAAIMDVLFDLGDEGAVDMIKDSLILKDLPDHFILRRLALKVAAKRVPEGKKLIIGSLKNDPSPAARQQAAILLTRMKTLDTDVRQTIIRDADCQVRGCWTMLLDEPQSSVSVKNALEVAMDHIVSEHDESCLLTVLRGLAQSLYSQVLNPVYDANAGVLRKMAGLMRQRPNIISPAIHPWWWLNVFLLETRSDRDALPFFIKLLERMSGITEGGRFFMDANEVGDGLTDDNERFLRTVTAAAALDFGLYARKTGQGWRFQRGLRHRTALWRIKDELTHPAYDKRQGHFHTKGRRAYGDFWFPSLVMAEVTRTRVPGEAMYFDELAGPGLHFPGPMAAAAADRQLSIVMPGVRTDLAGKGGRILNVFRKIKVGLNFRKMDDTRYNHLSEGSAMALRRYVGEFSRETGVDARIRSEDGYWERLLSAALPFDAFFNRNMDYFLSPTGNTLLDLAIVSAGVAGLILGRSWWLQRKTRTWREQIPLSIGGWGSRGKSGSERLKAAVFHGLGYRVFSKTTGTEAIFLSGFRDMGLYEIPLFRPYAKASIHEQRTCMKQAVDMGADVFLWECMALNPRYVSILAHDWMRDDIATITNTYPDHEDIQGPTGHDVANTIATFLPKHSRTVTMEQQMLPVLNARAKGKDTELKATQWSLPAMIPGEYGQRMPYMEHPLNIAMITDLARMLEIPKEEALFLMGEHLVPDIGVLKMYPDIIHKGRRMRFANTMAANERAGLLAGVNRLGLDEWDANDNLTNRTVLLVNNRADRPARSQVFATAIVEDISHNGVIIIGSATNHFKRLLFKAWKDHLKTSMDMLAPNKESQKQWLDRIFSPLRVRPEQTRDWAETLGRWLGIERRKASEIFKPLADVMTKQINSGYNFRHLQKGSADHTSKIMSGMDGFSAKDGKTASKEIALAVMCGYILDRIDEGIDTKTLSGLALPVVENIYKNQVAIVPEHAQSPADILEIATKRAPGTSITILVGMQNIKGPGLAFVNLWKGVDYISRTLAGLTGNPKHDRKILSDLTAYTGYTDITTKLVLNAVNRGKIAYAPDDPLYQKLLQRLGSVDKQSLSDKHSGSKVFRGLAKVIIAGLDLIVDPFDSLFRRKRSDLIMELLGEGLIGPQEAATRLHDVLNRQEYGPIRAWLDKRRA